MNHAYKYDWPMPAEASKEAQGQAVPQVVLDDADLARQMRLLHQVMGEDREILAALAKL